MKNKSINQIEAELLNGKQKPKGGFKLYLYNIAKYFLYIIYVLVQLVCAFIEILIYILSFGVVAISWHNDRKKGR